jgi:outer membrane protein OmpA-like peptidoglycan-associated protein
MEQRQPAPLRTPSRTAAKLAVAVLVAIAIGGIVLTALRQRASSEDPGIGAATPEGAPPLTAAASAATAAAAAAEDAAGPNGVVFAPSSDQLSEPARAKVVRIAETAINQHRKVAITTKFEALGDRARQRTLAQNRAVAIRQVLVAHGVLLGSMQIQISELPAGLVSPAEANKVELELR